jgi:hypothetical protein
MSGQEVYPSYYREQGKASMQMAFVGTHTWLDKASPFIVANKFFMRIADSAAHAAAVRLVGMLVQSPIPKMFSERNIRLLNRESEMAAMHT